MSSNKEINSLHSKAMDAAGRAFYANLHNYRESAQELFREAFQLERQAALSLIDAIDAEPSRSVLLRSAASLALDCREFREAERLVAIGLAGNPPSAIAVELRDLLETIYFSHHLSTRGLELDPTEFQITIAGMGVGFGLIESGQFLRRAEIMDKMLIRTVERRRGIAFRENGSPNRQAMNGFEVFYSTPRAASFAISVRLGRPQPQLMLPGFVGPSEVIEELLICIADFDAGDRERLSKRIPDEAYFNNFTGLAGKLAPDGQKIKTVGFTSVRGNETKQVALTRPAGNEWRPPVGKKEVVTVIGTIRSADETAHIKNHPVFGIEDDNGKRHNVTLPPGMLQDIVKPFWGERVQVTAIKDDKRLDYVDIALIENGALV